jgi:3-oxoacyl-[acyl-carrier-protein] synthase-3
MPSVTAPKSCILGTGAYAPDRVLTNGDLERLVDTSDAWITERTGIKERRVAADDQASSDMALFAAQRALAAAAHAGLTAKDLDMIIVGTVTPDLPMPACAAILQQKLGAGPIPSFDISAACAGFIYAMSIADQFIRSGAQKHVLIVGVELLSRILNMKDRTTCVLFGDGAGAAVLGPAKDDGAGILSTKLYTDSSLVGSLCIPAGGSKERLTPEALAAQRDKVHMAGQDIFKVAVKNLTSASRSALEHAELPASAGAGSCRTRQTSASSPRSHSGWIFLWSASCSTSSGTATHPARRSRSRSTKPCATAASKKATPF